MAPASAANLAELAAFASELADVARLETMRDRVFRVDNKLGDGRFDPVTEADRAAEQVIGDRIRTRFPDHGVVGEEYPEIAASSRFSWSIDPIDGTRAFICGLPSWTTLIALLQDGTPILGLIDAPRLDERYLSSGDGSWLEKKGARSLIGTSGCARIEEARLSTTDPFLFAGEEARGFERVRAKARTVRYSLDAYAYARVAAGSIDLVIESQLKPHDYNALIPVVRGAGGTVGDWNGGEDFRQGRVVAAASRALFDQAVDLLSAAG